MTAQLKEINQKLQAKKEYYDDIEKGQKYARNRTFQSNERKLYQQVGGVNTKTY